MPEPTLPPYTERQEKFASMAVRAMSAINIFFYRATGGRIGGKFLRGAPVMLLTTTGRTSGLPRTVPLIYLENGDDIVVVASKGGMSKHPVWYLNLQANPEATVEIGRRRLTLRARRVTDEEKAELWPRLLEIYRDYGDYQARTSRNIPVVALSPC
jgi:deazaflavin-dependent oxidoreductase (nitroreductase family)